MSEPDSTQSPGATVRVEHLSIRLPASFSHHASHLGKSVAEALVDLSVPAGGHLARLDVGKITVAHNMSSVGLSQAIASEIASALARRNQ